jgi:putative Mn2+ efflux pump MntP
MNYSTVVLISVALGIDAFSVALSIGLSGVRKNKILIMTAIVTMFHIFMPLLGLYLGEYLGKIAGPMAGAIGAFVLIAIGLSVIWKSVKGLGIFKLSFGKPSSDSRFETQLLSTDNLFSLVLLCASVSLDALTVGFGLGTLKVDLFLTVVTMGIIAGLMTFSGFIFGRRLNSAFGDWAEIVGGLILVGIGIKILFV